VLAALRAAVVERGPLCFASQRAAAASLAADLGLSVASVRRAIQNPQTAAEAAAIEAAILPRRPFTCELGPGPDDAAGFGGAPVSAPGEPVHGAPGAPVVRQGEPVTMGSVSSDASSQVSSGAPIDGTEGASRAREPIHPTTTAPPRPPQEGQQSTGPAEPYVLDGPPFPTDLAEYPRNIRRSQFPGECRLCRCGLDEGQAFILTPYGSAPARAHCMDCAPAGLALGQAEWVLAGKPIPKRRRERNRKPKSDSNPSPEE